MKQKLIFFTFFCKKNRDYIVVYIHIFLRLLLLPYTKMSIKIDNYHPLSSYYKDEKLGTSVMNTCLKKMLWKPQFLENIFEPLELKRSFEIYFELELMTLLVKITKEVLKYAPISLDKDYENVIFQNISGPFSTILGVDEYNYGWNLGGLILSKKKESDILNKEQYIKLIMFLLNFFKENHHFSPFYHKTDQELYSMIRNKIISTSFPNCEIEEIYKWSKIYPNSILYLIQKIYCGRINTWENQTVITEIKSFLCKKLKIESVDDLRIDNNILHLFYNDNVELKDLPFHSRKKLERMENNRLTSTEIKKLGHYTPSFLMENIYSIDTTNPHHLEYTQTFKMDDFVFSNRLQGIYYKLLSFYEPKKSAFTKSLQFNQSVFNTTLKEYFKKHFYSTLFSKMKRLEYRIPLLQTEDREIIITDEIDFISGYGDNFLGKILMEVRNEMKQYITSKENATHKESILFYLGEWLKLWKESTLDERKKIDFFFSFYFSFLKSKTSINNDIVYPLHLENVENHNVISSYLDFEKMIVQNFHCEYLFTSFHKQTQDDEIIDFIITKMSEFQNFNKSIVHHFHFILPVEMTEFKNNDLLNIKQYIVLKHFLNYE